ncbi:uncharacterized protein K460DRAFT_323357, partial [Cucurbitaria berberidis CBS 394.84]
MLVDPRLRDPTPKSAATFFRWTKLHFRDMLNIAADPKLGKMTKTLRFAAPYNDDGDEKSSEAQGEGYTKYLYTCIVDDVGILQSQPYYDISRLLNLEQTRDLGKEEETVSYEKEDAMVFDVVDARFAIYEEVEIESDTRGGIK